MEGTVLVAVISFLGTLVGTAGGIITSAKLTQYRLEQLEKRVEAQSKASAEIPIIEERLTNINRRVHSLEKRQNTNIGYFDTSQ